ncbi:MAG: type IV pilus modification PilV family protein [Candidatus Saccharimonadales bacterium]
MIKLKTNGDTIVEVLIALAIVGLVLMGAFVASQQSAKSTQQSRERTTALRIAESQLELLKTLSADPSSSIFSASNVFCLNPAVAGYYVQDAASVSGTPATFKVTGGPNAFPDLNTANDANSILTYDSRCVSGSGVHFNAVVDMPVATDGNHYTFEVHVRWDSIATDKHDEVVLWSRVDKTL